MPHKITHYSIKSKIKFSVKIHIHKKYCSKTTNIFFNKNSLFIKLSEKNSISYIRMVCVFFIKITVCKNCTLLTINGINLLTWFEFFYLNDFIFYYNYYANEIVYVKTLGELFWEHSNHFHCWTIFIFIFLIFTTQWIPSYSVMCCKFANESIHGVYNNTFWKLQIAFHKGTVRENSIWKMSRKIKKMWLLFKLCV